MSVRIRIITSMIDFCAENNTCNILCFGQQHKVAPSFLPGSRSWTNANEKLTATRTGPAPPRPDRGRPEAIEEVRDAPPRPRGIPRWLRRRRTDRLLQGRLEAAGDQRLDRCRSRLERAGGTVQEGVRRVRLWCEHRRRAGGLADGRRVPVGPRRGQGGMAVPENPGRRDRGDPPEGGSRPKEKAWGGRGRGETVNRNAIRASKRPNDRSGIKKSDHSESSE